MSAPWARMRFLRSLTGVGRHDQLDLAAEGSADHGVGDTSVAGGRVQDHLVPGQLPDIMASTSILRTGPVFYGTAGVELLVLGQDLGVAEVQGKVQFDHRRVADGLEGGVSGKEILEGFGLGQKGYLVRVESLPPILHR